MPSLTITASVVTTTTVPPTTTSLPTATTLSTGDLDNPKIREVTIDGEPFLVAWADTPATRSRGLMEVDDLGDLDGMLFDLGSQRGVAFTMRNTLIPLDIYFFDTDGRGVGMLEMVPCEAEPCPTYSIDDPARYALELPATHPDLAPDPVLALP